MLDIQTNPLLIHFFPASLNVLVFQFFFFAIFLDIMALSTTRLSSSSLGLLSTWLDSPASTLSVFSYSSLKTWMITSYLRLLLLFLLVLSSTCVGLLSRQPSIPWEETWYIRGTIFCYIHYNWKKFPSSSQASKHSLNTSLINMN